MARSYLRFGEACEPKPGAIVVFPRGKNPTFGHVAFVLRVIGDQIEILEGNAADAVRVSKRPVKQALGFRWPVKRHADAPLHETPVWVPSARAKVNEDVRRVQRRLRELGYKPGLIDGIAGENTADAVAAFQRRHNLPGQRGAWYESYNTVLKDAKNIIPEARAKAKPKDLEAIGDKPSVWLRTGRNLQAWGAGLLTLLGMTLPEEGQPIPGAIRQTQQALESIGQAASWIATNWLTLTVGVLVISAAILHLLRKQRAEAFARFDLQGPEVRS
jgi:hypothetical protein